MNSSTQSINEETTRSPATEKADLKLEVVVIPVSDVERAKTFYARLGFAEIRIATIHESQPISPAPSTTGGSCR